MNEGVSKATPSMARGGQRTPGQRGGDTLIETLCDLGEDKGVLIKMQTLPLSKEDIEKCLPSRYKDFIALVKSQETRLRLSLGVKG